MVFLFSFGVLIVFPLSKGDDTFGLVLRPWSCKVRVGSNGNLLWEASVLLGRKKDTLKFTAMPFGLTNAPAVFMELISRCAWRIKEPSYRIIYSRYFKQTEVKGEELHVKMIVEFMKEEKMYVKFFQQRGSGAKRKLSRCGRNQMGNEPILALPEGADDFVVYYDARSKDLEACLEKKGEVNETWRVIYTDHECLQLPVQSEGIVHEEDDGWLIFS
ncbi:hypothetical protein Tco_0805491 [Tanacetum coccineum]